MATPVTPIESQGKPLHEILYHVLVFPAIRRTEDFYMQELKVIDLKGQRVLTSRQLASSYGVEEKHIKQNFANNRKRYLEGKHYVTLQNQELRIFKNKVENFDLVGKTAKIIYLWTEKGSLLHAKSLNTDKAWEVYDYLVDYYFRANESVESAIPLSPKQLPAALNETNENILAYNRGFLFGVFRAEVDNRLISLETIYSMLSDSSKQLIHRELLGLDVS